jgi:hypothetical protein
MPIDAQVPADAPPPPRIAGPASGLLAMLKLWRWARAIDKAPPVG